MTLLEVQRARLHFSTTHTRLSPVSIAQVITTVACSCEELSKSVYLSLDGEIASCRHSSEELSLYDKEPTSEND